MAVPTRELVSPTDLFNGCSSQPRTQASSRYPSYQRRLGTESLTGDVTSEIAEDDWERGWRYPFFEEPGRPDLMNGRMTGSKHFFKISLNDSKYLIFMFWTIFISLFRY